MDEECEKYLKSSQENRKYVADHFKPLHTSIYTLTDDIFVTSFVHALKSKTPNALMEILKEEHPGIFSFDLFQPDFCYKFLEEVLWFESWCEKEKIKMQRPNSMNNYGVILADLGFTSFLNKLMTEKIVPFSSLLFKDVGGDSLDEHHGFIVEYRMGKDTSLGYHTDDSEVTLNVNIGKEFSDGTLYYHGLRCRSCHDTAPLPGEYTEIKHKLGRAVLNRGQHRHGAYDITSGERFNLILWCRSKQYRQQNKPEECPTWCGWHKYN